VAALDPIGFALGVLLNILAAVVKAIIDAITLVVEMAGSPVGSIFDDRGGLVLAVISQALGTLCSMVIYLLATIVESFVNTIPFFIKAVLGLAPTVIDSLGAPRIVSRGLVSQCRENSGHQKAGCKQWGELHCASPINVGLTCCLH